MTEVFDESIQYQPMVSNHPTPVYRTLTPQGNNSIQLSTTSVVGSVDIVIPPAVINYSKSRLSFLLILPQPTQDAGNNRAIWLNANLGNLFSRIALTDTLTGATIADISNFDFYANMVSGAGTKVDDLLTKASAPALFDTQATSLLNPVEEIGKAMGTAVADCNYVGYSNAALTNAIFTQFSGKRQFYIGQLTTGTGNTGVGDIYLQVSIPLSAFKMSFFSVDKNIYTPTNWNLSLFFNPTSSFCYVSRSISIGDSNPGAYAPNAGAVVPAISNISLITCNEGNLALSSQIISKVMGEGLSMPFSYPTVSRFVASAASSHAVNLMLSRAYGSRILGIMTVGYETLNNNTKVRRRGDWIQYNTFLNSVPILSAAGFNIKDRGEDYSIANRHIMNDSAVQTSGEYALSEYFFFDSWVGQIALHEMDKKQTMVDGLDVSSQNSVWSLTGSTTGNRTFNWTTVVFGQKVINLSNQGATVI